MNISYRVFTALLVIFFLAVYVLAAWLDNQSGT